MNYRVVLADDEPEVLRSIQRTLDWEKYGFSVVGAFLNGLDVLEFLENHDVDIVFTDIRMPFMDGIELIRWVREWSTIPIIVVSARGREEDKVKALDFGADDYITKPFNPLELLARVKSMMRRYTSLGSIAEKNNVIRIGDVELDKDAKEVRVNGKLVKMTATEYGILQLLMENAGKVFSIDEIYERVWNESSFSPENTVSVHIRRIREKIEINPKEPRYLKVVWGIGYKIEKI